MSCMHVADIHDVGLMDLCGGCAESAEQPFSRLDERALRTLVERTLRNRFGGRGPDDDSEPAFGDYCSPRSDTEARAMAVVMTHLEKTGRLAEVAPDALSLYLVERWGVPALIERRRVPA